MASKNEFQEFLKDKKLNTAKSYVSSFERIMKNIDEKYSDEKTYTAGSINRRFGKIEKYLELQSLSSRKVLLNGLIKFLIFVSAKESIMEKFNDLFKKIATESDNMRVYKKPSKKELDNKIDYKDLDKYHESYKGQLKSYFVYNIDIPYLMISLYSKFVPLRQSEWTSSVVVNECDDNMKGNYVCLKHGKVHINDYKTVDSYGSKTLDLPTDLLDIIETITKKHGTKYLLPNRGLDDHMTSSEFTKLSNKAFKKKISSSMLRKIYISEKLSDNSFSGEQRKELAKQLSHSPATQSLIYTRFTEWVSPSG